jgi:TPR repeat protein
MKGMSAMTGRTGFLALVMAACLAFAAPVLASPTPADIAFNAGVTSYSAGDIPEAVSSWKAASNSGHMIASWLLANLYDQGKGVPRDAAAAFAYFQRAAKAGHPDAAIKVAEIYHEGSPELGIKRDYKQALPMYERAALAARSEAQYQLGKMYAFGEGVSPRPSEALRWQILAAKKRYTPSLLEMARLYFNGEGVTTDRTEGWMYLILAGRFANSSQRASVSAAMSKYSGRMKSSDRDEASRRADEWITANPLPK